MALYFIVAPFLCPFFSALFQHQIDFPLKMDFFQDPIHDYKWRLFPTQSWGPFKIITQRLNINYKLFGLLARAYYELSLTTKPISISLYFTTRLVACYLTSCFPGSCCWHLPNSSFFSLCLSFDFLSG